MKEKNNDFVCTLLISQKIEDLCKDEKCISINFDNNFDDAVHTIETMITYKLPCQLIIDV